MSLLLHFQRPFYNCLSVTSPRIRLRTRTSPEIVYLWHLERQFTTAWWKIFCLPDFVFPHPHLLTPIQTKSTRTWTQPFSSFRRKSNYPRMSFLQSLLKIFWNHTERLHHIWFNITVLQSPDFPREGSVLLTPRLTPQTPLFDTTSSQLRIPLRFSQSFFRESPFCSSSYSQKSRVSIETNTSVQSEIKVCMYSLCLVSI